MKYLDLAIQSLLILFLIGGGIYDITTAGDIYLTLIAQFLIGSWQFVSCIITVVMKVEPLGSRQHHFFAAVTYLAFLIIVISGLPKYLMIVGLIAPAWALAAYYYYITWRFVFPKGNAGKFLPHVFR